MTIDEGLELADLLLRLRREVAGIARGVDVTSPTFIVEWRAALEELQARIDHVARLEGLIEPVLAAGERITLIEYRAWLVRMTQPDEEGRPVPATAPTRALHPSVH